MKLTNQLLLGLVLVLVLVSLVDAFTVENKITGHFVDTITGSFTETITGSFAESLSASFDVDNFPPEIQVALEFIGDAGDLVTILVNTSDANDDTVYVNYSSPLNSSGQWQSTVNDYGIHYALITAFDYSTQSNQTIAIKLRPYCGDLSCDYHAIGETCTSCPEDCGICPETPPSGGGGGGSSKIIELEEEISRLKNQTPSASQFEIISNELYIELQKDEFQGQQIRIKNNLDKDLFLTTKVHGGIIGSLFFDSQKIKIPANNQEIFDFIALANKPEGTYEGILTFESEDTYQTISIIIKIIPKIEIPVESLDLSVNLITQEIEPGDILKFELNLRKDPLLITDQENVILKYLVLKLDPKHIGYISGAAITGLENLTQGEGIVYEEEQLLIKDIISLPKEIIIPDNFATGEYILSVNAEYKGEMIPLFVKFSVKSPWYQEEYYGLPKMYIIAGSVFIAFMLILLLFLLSKHLKKKETKNKKPVKKSRKIKRKK